MAASSCPVSVSPAGTGELGCPPAAVYITHILLGSYLQGSVVRAHPAKWPHHCLLVNQAFLSPATPRSCHTLRCCGPTLSPAGPPGSSWLCRTHVLSDPLLQKHVQQSPELAPAAVPFLAPGVGRKPATPCQGLTCGGVESGQIDQNWQKKKEKLRGNLQMSKEIKTKGKLTK